MKDTKPYRIIEGGQEWLLEKTKYHKDTQSFYLKKFGTTSLDLGNLNHLQNLTDWSIHLIGVEEDYGLAYRIGVGQFMNNDITIYAHFGVPLSRLERELTASEKKSVCDEFAKIGSKYTYEIKLLRFIHDSPSKIPYPTETPDFWIKELETILKKL